MQDLAREVPVVERLGRVDALVALQPDQRQVERLGDRLGQRGLAGAGLALEQQRPLHPQREERDRGQRLVAQVPRVAEAGGDVVGRRRQGRLQRLRFGPLVVTLAPVPPAAQHRRRRGPRASWPSRCWPGSSRCCATRPATRTWCSATGSTTSAGPAPARSSPAGSRSGCRSPGSSSSTGTTCADLHPGRAPRPGPRAVRRVRHRGGAAPRVRRGPHARLGRPALPAAARAAQHQHRLAVAGEQQPRRPLQPGSRLQPRAPALAAGAGQLGRADVLRARGDRPRRAAPTCSATAR